MTKEQSQKIQEGMDNLIRLREDLELAHGVALAAGQKSLADTFECLEIRIKSGIDCLFQSGVTVEALETRKAEK